MNRVDHGPTISGEEYDERVVKLHTDRPRFSVDDEIALQRAELSIMIDHRLGICFPYDRRDDLWDAQQSIQKRKGRLFLLILLRMVGFDRLSKIVWEEFSKVLDSDEMLDFFGEDFYTKK